MGLRVFIFLRHVFENPLDPLRCRGFDFCVIFLRQGGVTQITNGLKSFCVITALAQFKSIAAQWICFLRQLSDT